MRAKGVVPEGMSVAPRESRSFAPAALRMTALARFVKGEIEISHFYLRHAACVILSERAERARAKDLLEDRERGGPAID